MNAPPVPAPPGRGAGGGGAHAPFERSRLSYAGTFRDRRAARVIRTMEWATGKRALLRRVRRLEAAGVPHGPAFWPRALEALGIDLRTPEAEIARLPRTGPLVVVANHPHGLVDGLALAALVARRRPDHAILARALLTGVREVEEHTIPVPFPHDPDARCGMLAMRAEATARLARGGCVALFPAGGVAAAERALGPAVEGEWSAFTAKLIRRSGAGVVPVRFGGRNSRAYQIAGRLSPVLRQGLLIHEVRRSLDRPIRPVIGEAIGPEALAAMGPPRRMMAALRARTLALEPS